MDVLFFTVAITRYTDRYHQDHAAKRPKLDTIKSSKHSTRVREGEHSLGETEES